MKLTLNKSTKKRIIFLISIQIALILGSMIALAYLEHQTSKLGNVVNVAGKNRFLLNDVIVSISNYKSGNIFGTSPNLALVKLHENIHVVKSGGIQNGLNIPPISEHYLDLWNEIEKEYRIFASKAKQVIFIQDSGNKIQDDDMIFLQESSKSLFNLFDELTLQLSNEITQKSSELVLLQITLSSVNIVVHIILIYIIIKIINTSLQRQYELELAQKNIPGKIRSTKMETIGHLASSLAHDIRNPLSIIKNSLEVMCLSHNYDKNDELRFEKINNAIYRISHQIEDVLDFIKEKPLSLQSESLLRIIKKSTEFLVIPKNIKLKLPKEDMKIICDRKLLQPVFSNLILNAIQAINNEAGEINISFMKDTDSYKIIIQDSGPGVSKKIRDSLFEPLVTTKLQGTGLGLASCKKSIEAHGGTITYEDSPSRFIIKLPQRDKLQENV